MIKTTIEAKYLLQYLTLMKQKVVDLRKEACDVAAVCREIERLITEEDKVAVKDQLDADKAWSFKQDKENDFDQSILALLKASGDRK